MAVCAAMLNSVYGKHISLLENHFNPRNVGNYFLPPEKINALYEKGKYCSKYGIEYLIRNLYTDCTDDSTFDESSVSVSNSGLYYFPQSYLVNKEIFDYEFNIVMDKLYMYLENRSYAVFTDTESSSNITTNKILSTADLVVVCIDQSFADIFDYLDTYSSLTYKSIFLVGKYDPENHPNLEEITHVLKVPERYIGLVPYDHEFERSIKKGELMRFVVQNNINSPIPETRYFIKEMRRTAAILYDKIEYIKAAKTAKTVSQAYTI